MNNVIFLFKKTTCVFIATVGVIFVGFYGRENIRKKVNQEENGEGYMESKKK